MNHKAEAEAGTETEKKVIEVREERVQLSKEQIVTGTVTVHKKVNTEVEQYDMSLLNEEVEVHRIQVNKKVANIPETRLENGVTIIPIVREVAVVTKVLMLIEEVHISKKTEYKTETVEVPIQKESVTIDRNEEQKF